MNRPLRCVLFLLLIPIPVWAQAPAAAPAPNAASTVGYEWEGRIKLDVTVTDKSGKAVSGLASTDFSLLDNGQPAKIVSFSAYDGVDIKPDPPVEIIFVIDAANHTKDQTSDAQFGITKFLRRNGGHLEQSVEIYRVSGAGLSATASPSTDGNALADAISRKDGLRAIPLGLTPPGPPAPRPGQGSPARPNNPAPPAPRLAPDPASAHPRRQQHHRHEHHTPAPPGSNHRIRGARITG